MVKPICIRMGPQFHSATLLPTDFNICLITSHPEKGCRFVLDEYEFDLLSALKE